MEKDSSSSGFPIPFSTKVRNSEDQKRFDIFSLSSFFAPSKFLQVVKKIFTRLSVFIFTPSFYFCRSVRPGLKRRIVGWTIPAETVEAISLELEWVPDPARRRRPEEKLTLKSSRPDATRAQFS